MTGAEMIICMQFLEDVLLSQTSWRCKVLCVHGCAHKGQTWIRTKTMFLVGAACEALKAPLQWNLQTSRIAAIRAPPKAPFPLLFRIIRPSKGAQNTPYPKQAQQVTEEQALVARSNPFCLSHLQK